MNTILDLPGFMVLDRQETEHDIRFTVAYVLESLVCPRCGSMERPNRHGILIQVYMDMPIRAKRVGLAVKVRRYKCKDCRRTYMQEIAFLDEKRAATQRLVHYIQAQNLTRTFARVADYVGITAATVRITLQYLAPPLRDATPY